MNLEKTNVAERNETCPNIDSEQILNVNFEANPSTPIKKKRLPRKVTHFSDGTLEEYSTDEDEKDSENLINKTVEIDESTLPWNEWFFHKGKKGGQSILAACDYVGESLADAFGITSQKYFYEVEEYKRCIEEEEAELKEEAEQMAGWTTGPNSGVTSADNVELNSKIQTLQKIQLEVSTPEIVERF